MLPQDKVYLNRNENTLCVIVGCETGDNKNNPYYTVYGLDPSNGYFMSTNVSASALQVIDLPVPNDVDDDFSRAVFLLNLYLTKDARWDHPMQRKAAKYVHDICLRSGLNGIASNPEWYEEHTLFHIDQMREYTSMCAIQSLERMVRNSEFNPDAEFMMIKEGTYETLLSLRSRYQKGQRLAILGARLPVESYLPAEKLFTDGAPIGEKGDWVIILRRNTVNWVELEKAGPTQVHNGDRVYFGIQLTEGHPPKEFHAALKRTADDLRTSCANLFPKWGREQVEAFCNQQ